MIISITNLKGGVGKTTSAMALAAAAVRAGEDDVRVIDCDPQGSATGWADMAEEAGEDLGFHVDVANARRLARLKGERGICLIDCPPHGAVVNEAVAIADLVVVPANPSPSDIQKTWDTVGTLVRNGRPYGVLLTRVMPNTRALRAILESIEERGVSFFDTRIPQREDLKNFFGHAFGDSLYGYEGAWAEISAIMGEVRDVA